MCLSINQVTNSTSFIIECDRVDLPYLATLEQVLENVCNSIEADFSFLDMSCTNVYSVYVLYNFSTQLAYTLDFSDLSTLHDKLEFELVGYEIDKEDYEYSDLYDYL